MVGLFTKDERAVIVFLAVSIALGSLILAARRVEPSFAPGLAPEQAVETAGAGSAVAAEPRLIDINAAGTEELTRLPGIGPARARAIVALRLERGAFASVDELLDVRGIGPVTLEGLRPFAVAGAVGVAARSERSREETACRE